MASEFENGYIVVNLEARFNVSDFFLIGSSSC